jgi:hypothetical protein
VAASFIFAAPACGTEDAATTERAQPQAQTKPAKLRDCQTVGRDPRGEIVLCQENAPDNHGVFLVDDGQSLRLLAAEPPGDTATASDAGRVGHWAWAALSPDGSTLLAQWSAECEVPIAFFIPAGGGEPRVVTGEDDWATSPTSIALGWTTDGRAIVLFPETSPCGVVGDAGLYLMGTDGTHTRIRRVDRFSENLERSVEARTASSLKRR